MLDDRLEGVLSESRLPSLPAVARRILALAESGDATIAEIAEAVELDQAMVVRLLRTVNSSYYALPKPCANVPQAATLLGLRAVRSIVLGFSLAKSIDGGDDREIDFPWRQYWRRTVRIAVAARLIARFSPGIDPDEAQLVGLLSEVGMVSMYRAFGDRYLQVMDEGRGDHSRMLPQERRNFEVDHGEVGEVMSERWGLPREIGMAIASHECEPVASMSGLQSVASLACLAERATGITDARGRAFAEAAFLRLGESILGMRRADATRLLESIGRRALELAAMLEIDIGNTADGEQLLDRARTLQGSEGASDATTLSADDGRCVFDRRLAEQFSNEVNGTALLAIEPDGAVGARRDCSDALSAARLEARLTETAGANASLHRLTPTLLALILPVGHGTDGPREAMRVAERLRRDVASGAAAPHGRAGNSISVGVAVHGANRFESPDALLRAAMLALGAAQRGGRNRVGLFKPAHDPMTAAQQIR